MDCFCAVVIFFFFPECVLDGTGVILPVGLLWFNAAVSLGYFTFWGLFLPWARMVSVCFSMKRSFKLITSATGFEEGSEPSQRTAPKQLLLMVAIKCVES